MTKSELTQTALDLVPPGKGILAADESLGTIQKRFDRINVKSTEEVRRSYREMLFTTPKLEEHISGVILFDETIRHATVDGTPFTEVLSQRGIIPGIKVDKGAKALAGFPGEKITEGLDGLRERLSEYRELGARFAKWRAVITIGENIPTGACIAANGYALAQYAALCQEAGLVPIVEPEVLLNGDHDIQRCAQVSESTWTVLFTALHRHRVMLEGLLLKTNMVLPGKDCPTQASVEEIAEATVNSLRNTVPPSMPGVVFLSGGMSYLEATERLNAMNVMGDHPWQLSFSYGRALQETALDAWQGDAANVPAGQAALYQRAKCNGAARDGRYTKEMEAVAA
jgi:fructose-bisphosphate aldolase class I